MAKKTTGSSDKVTVTFDPSTYKEYRKKWANKKEFERVTEVRDRFDVMRMNRRTSCPFASNEIATRSGAEGGDDNPDNTLRAGRAGGTDWAKHWDNNWKLYTMYHEYLQDRSNLKSPITFAPIQALLSEFQENNIAVLIRPTQDEDKPKIRILSDTEKFWESKTDARVYKKSTFLETIVCGTSLPFNGWQKRARYVDIVVTGKETKKEMDKKKAIIDEQKNEKLNKIKLEAPITKRELIYEYNDCVYIPTSLYEIFVDPDARLLRGPAYEATDMVWRNIVSVEQAMAEFKNSLDPYVIKDNITRIVSARDAEGYYTESEPFFRVPTDVSGNKVELIRYYNKQTDKYIIVANDVILRDGPLPYNHKELPFSIHICYELKNQLYGAGIPAFTESIQAEDETTRNMKLDQMKIDGHPPLFVNSDVFPDVDSQYEDNRPGAIYEIGGSTGPENLRYLERNKVDYDYYRMKDALREDAIFATGINPLAYAMPKAGEAVRTNMLSMESTLKAAKKIFQNWADGWKDSVRQRIRIRQQMLPLSYVEQMDTTLDKKSQDKKYPTIRIKGSKLLVDRSNDGSVNVSEKILQPNEESFFNFKDIFEIDDKYLELAGDLDLQIDSDSLVPVSTAIQIQLITDAMTVLIPILSNPVMLNSPGIPQLVREYIQRNGLPEKIIEGLQNESDTNEEKRAIEQESYLTEGMSINGIPGESDRHKFTHVMTMMALLNKKNQMMKMGPYGVGPQEMQMIDDIIMNLQQHLAIDSLGRTESVSAVLNQAQGQSANALPQNGAPGMAGQPSPNSQVPKGMSNMSNMPGVPPQMQMSQMGGSPLNSQGPMGL